MKKFLVYLAGLALVLCTSCAKDPEATPTAPTVPNNEKPTDLLTYDIADGPESRYVVNYHLSHANAGTYGLYQVVREGGKTRLELLAHMHGPQMDSSIQCAASGESLEVALFDGASPSDEPRQVLKVQLPKDLVIAGAVDAAAMDFTGISRLYFHAGSALLTHGKDLKILVHKLIAENGAVIETFPAADRAADNNAGRSGGKLEIAADQAFGELNVNLRGQNAGVWTITPPSRENDESYRGPKGPTGSPNELFCGPFLGPVCLCAKLPGRGGPGGLGQPGTVGFAGLSGGDSGDLNVTIKDGSHFLINFRREVGFGGQGSAGSIGGPGGFGGDPGPNPARPVKVCPDAAPGSTGSVGPRGPQGAPGKNGQTGQVCLKLSETIATSCM